MPVVHVKDHAITLGGAGNVVRNIVALGARCRVCSALGDDPDGDLVEGLLDELGVDCSALQRVPGRPTPRKSRIVARSQQIVRVDRESLEPLPADAARRFVADAARAGEGADGVILEDYGKGLFTASTVRRMMQRLIGAGVPVAVDPKGELGAYKGADLLKPNLREAEALSGIAVRSEADLERLAARLRSKIGGGALAITRGGEGISLFEGRALRVPGVHVPTPRREVFDVQGAGDTAIAALWLAVRAGGSLREAAVVANAAAGAVVGKVGTATATRSEVRRGLARAIVAAEART